MNGFTEIPPKQKFMTISEIYETFGSRAVVAYSCKVIDSVPRGGFVIAVQNQADKNVDILKEYRRQFTKKFPGKRPVYYLRAEKPKAGDCLSYTYNGGSGDIKAIQKIELKKSKTQAALESIPNELLARALITSLIADEDL